MGQNSTTADSGDGKDLFTGEAWFDQIEAGVRGRVRGFIEELLEQELTAALGRHRHERAADTPNESIRICGVPALQRTGRHATAMRETDCWNLSFEPPHRS